MTANKQKLIQAVKSLSIFAQNEELKDFVTALSNRELPDDITLSKFILHDVLRKYPEIMQDPKNQLFREFCLSINETPEPTIRPSGRK